MNIAALLNLLALAAIWGASFLFMRQLVPAIGVMPTAFFRVFLSAIGLVVILLAMRTRWDFRGKLWRILLIGVISSGIPVLMYSLAAQTLPGQETQVAVPGVGAQEQAMEAAMASQMGL